jgi:long-subunit acyl-CoA synthetase (AMP-forming)
MSAGIPFAQASWAVQVLGATAGALNPTLPARALARRTELVRPRLVVRDGMLEDAPRSRPMPAPPDITATDIAFLQTTSGTTGEPRAAMVRHRNVLAYLHTRGHEAVSPDDVLTPGYAS